MPSVLQKAAAHLLLPSLPAVLPGAGLQAGGSGRESLSQQQGRPALLVVCRLDLSRERGLQWNAWFFQERFLYLLWRGVGWVFLFFVSSPPPTFFFLTFFFFSPFFFICIYASTFACCDG